jgi:hypothetical protein
MRSAIGGLTRWALVLCVPCAFFALSSCSSGGGSGSGSSSSTGTGAGAGAGGSAARTDDLTAALEQLEISARSYSGGNSQAQAILQAAADHLEQARHELTLGRAGEPLTEIAKARDALAVARRHDLTVDHDAEADRLARLATPYLRVNHLQVRGTHNSYHIEPPVPLSNVHRYTHKPLGEQLEVQGVRAFELDLHKTNGVFEVYHIPVIDQQTTCLSFLGCLQEIKAWSDQNPAHHPIFVWMELKDAADLVKIQTVAEIDVDIRSVFPPEQLLTPDDVKGNFASVRDALDNVGWPHLKEVRGRVMFCLLEGEGDRLRDYTHGYTSLDGRVIFGRAEPARYGEPWAAVTKINDPRNAAAIQAALNAKLLVACNTAGAGDFPADNDARRAAALVNGPTMLHDDFPDLMLIPGGAPSRVNELTAPGSIAVPSAIEDPAIP